MNPNDIYRGHQSLVSPSHSAQQQAHLRVQQHPAMSSQQALQYHPALQQTQTPATQAQQQALLTAQQHEPRFAQLERPPYEPFHMRPVSVPGPMPPHPQPGSVTSSVPPPPPPPNKAQAPERYTISEDRSAGSNLEVRNLAALRDRAASQKLSEQVLIDPVIMRAFQTNSLGRSASEISTGHVQLQQRFGLLRFDEEHPGEHMGKGDQPILEDDLCTANIPAGRNYLRTRLIVRHDWVEDIQGIDANSELQANIETLQRNLASMQKELAELEMQKQMHANKQFEILYRIEGTCYFDHPEWTQGNKSVVSRSPVKNLDLFLERNKNIVFIVYRDFDHVPPRTGAGTRLPSPRHIRESIHPVSRHLRKALQMMLKHDWRYESMFLQLRRKGEIDAPYLFIYHHRAHWRDLLAQCPHTVREQLKLLAVYVSETYGMEYMAADALFAKRKVSREFIQYLVQPGDILISRDKGQYRGLVASSWPRENTGIPAAFPQGAKVPAYGYNHLRPHSDPLEPRVGSEAGSDTDSELDSDIGTTDQNMRSAVEEAVEDKKQDLLPRFLRRILAGTTSEEKDNEKEKSLDKGFEIRTWLWQFDGDFKRVEGSIMLQLSQSSVNGPTKAEEWNIHDLNVYPLRLAPESLIQKLRHRGLMFWQCRKRCLVSYHESDIKAQDESDERFMVDFSTFRQLHSENNSFVIGQLVETMTQAEMEQDKPPDEAFYYLVPLQTKGFNLRTKKWLDLDVDQIGPVVWNEKAFDSLVLDKDRKTKELITALVSKQISSSKSTDVVAGKGNGLILLLHGGPGTGKTLTAEGVAEIAKKPLYRVTCGDVGTKAEEVEKYLESVLHLGKLWDCVVLLDEAEVFLERRSLDDLQRNALVSVFLRVIEYHEGILILTSNRVGTFDEAFRSRIQIAIHYPPLRAYQRLQIWKNFFDRLESFKDGSVHVDDLRDHLEELQGMEMNGRQIRNAITTARQYADWKGKIMNYEHLKIALDVAAEFNNYSEKLRGGFTDDQIAEDEGIR